MSNKLQWLDAVSVVATNTSKLKIYAMVLFILLTWFNYVWTAFWILLYITWYHDTLMKIWTIVDKIMRSTTTKPTPNGGTSVSSNDL